MKSGERFEAPEALLDFSADGMTRLSHVYHRFLRERVISARWASCRRPVLINNWEATHADFNSEKILAIARKGAELGVEMFVLDDGWFGKRDDDNSGQGRLVCKRAETSGRTGAAHSGHQ